MSALLGTYIVIERADRLLEPPPLWMAKYHSKAVESVPPGQLPVTQGMELKHPEGTSFAPFRTMNSFTLSQLIYYFSFLSLLPC